jgi:hypothetical protein
MTVLEIQRFFADAPWALPLVAVIGIWSLFWSIIGLWTAARNGHKAWFAVFVFVHSLGLLEILYLNRHRRTQQIQSRIEHPRE